jgi:hypothetical protein
LTMAPVFAPELLILIPSPNDRLEPRNVERGWRKRGFAQRPVIVKHC